MYLKLLILIIGMLKLVQGQQPNESLSFSPPINNSITPTPSFWFGTINSTLLEKDFQLEVHLNKPQGLLFYAIDHLYQTLWLEFETNTIIISYYNFKNGNNEPFRFDIRKLCKVPRLDDTIINIKLSLSETTLKVYCNGNEEMVYYSPSPSPNDSAKMQTFFDEMKNPIPSFNMVSGTHVWIGNTPDANVNEYRNKKVQSQSKNLVGCVKSCLVGGDPVRLVTSGIRQGNMIDEHCRPICGTTPCHNGARCIERWRDQFICNCGLSGFLGRLCNESYSVLFNDDRTVTIDSEYKLESFQMTMRHLRKFGNSETYKVLSIEFIFEKNLYVYIDQRRYLQIKFTAKDFQATEATFIRRIENNRTYVLLISAGTDGLDFKLADSINRHILEQKRLTIDGIPSLVTKRITVGDSHSESMRWMKRFTGCISNLLLSNEKRKFSWNMIPDFHTLPTCQKKKIITDTKNITESYSDKRILYNTIKPEGSHGGKVVDNASTSYILIGVGSIIVILVVVAVVMYKYIHVRNKKELVMHKKPIIQNEKTLSFDAVTYTPYSTPNSPPIKYKPPYKAGSFSQSSNIGKSVTSLPSSITATLVTPEDPDC